MITKRLTVLVGPPGSGKSTLAREYCAKGGVTYINQDSQGKDHLSFFHVAICKGDDIIVDRMGFNKAQRERYIKPAKEAGYYIHIIVLHQPYSVCLERIRARKDHETIKDEQSARAALATFFGKYERPQEDEADKVDFRYPEGAKDLAIICDLDGTLCKLDHRLHFVRRPEGERKDWKSFFEHLDKDEINYWCLDILDGLADKCKIVFCSGRPDMYRKPTMEWLENKCGFSEPDALFMRPRNDQRDDSIVKEIILDFEILTRFTPYFMIDDRKRVVEMWRKRGFTCLACAEGDF